MAAQTPAPVGKVTVRPGTATVTVTITGNNPTAWTSQSGAATHTMPLAISASTDFWLVRGTYTVTTTLSGVTIDVSTVQIESGTGATVDPKADTLTELAGLLSAGSGASGATIEKFASHDTTVPSDTWTSIAWGTAAGADLLAMTDPLNPTVKAEGVYRVTCHLAAAAATGKFYAAELDLDLNGVDDWTILCGDLEASGAVSSGMVRDISWEASVAANGVINLTVKHDVGSDHNFAMKATVAKIG